MQTVLHFIGWTIAAFVAVGVLIVIYVLGVFYIYRPLAHRVQVSVAERINAETYETGTGYVFEMKFSAEVGDRSISVSQSIACIPKREAGEDFVSGPMTFDMLKLVAPPTVRVPLVNGQELLFKTSELDCENMVRSLKEPEIARFTGANSHPNLSPLTGDEPEACIISLEQGEQRIGGLLVHRPQVANVTEQPVSGLISPEDYGPADRRLIPRVRPPRQDPEREYFFWLSNLKCWASSKDGASDMRAPAKCSERGATVCGFP